MSIPSNPKASVGKLVGMARKAASMSRSHPSNRDYWQGMSHGYLSAARATAHDLYGLSWANARIRRICRAAHSPS